MKEKTLQFTFVIQHVPGKEMFAADAFSRYPVGKPGIEDKEFSQDMDVCTIRVAASIISSIQLSTTTIDHIKDAACVDPQYLLLLKKITNKTFSSTQSEDVPSIRAYFNVKDRRSIMDGIIIYTFGDKAW